ncbi:MAG TPA: lysylphosphatidylglycerol synthase transmembrane domain-containing protein [Bryobacteraceae bacterium]|nr:lysylphosphatidylglycerol synthase transmembrane domain-containing protein [Bryobacteraceae bacterium]
MGDKRSRVLLILTYLASLGCLVWTLRGANLGELKDDIATMDWWWLGLAVIADISVYCWQTIRWRLLLRPVEPVSFRQAVSAIYVGLFANEVLPFRAGEVLRCYMVSRWTTLPFSVVISSALIERIFDGIWLCLCLILTLHLVPPHHHMRWLKDSGYVMGIVVFSGAALLILAMLLRQRTRALFSGDGWQRHVRVLIDDLNLIGHSRYLYFAFLQSLPYLLLQVIPIYAAMQAYPFDQSPSFDPSISVAFALMVILRLGSVVPQAPGNLGLFQFLTKEALQHMFHVAPAEAARFSLVLWGTVTIPLLVVGFGALMSSGSKLFDLKRAAEDHASEMSKNRS